MKFLENVDYAYSFYEIKKKIPWTDRKFVNFVHNNTASSLTSVTLLRTQCLTFSTKHGLKVCVLINIFLQKLLILCSLGKTLFSLLKVAKSF